MTSIIDKVILLLMHVEYNDLICYLNKTLRLKH